MRLRKWYTGLAAAVMFLCILALPAAAAEAKSDFAADVYSAADDTETASEAEEVTLSPAELTLQYVGQTAETVLSGADGLDVVWTSSNTAVAVVDDGVVTAVDNGTAAIRVYTGDTELASCEVTVSLYTGISRDLSGQTQNYYYYQNGVIYDEETVQYGTVNGESGWWYINSEGRVDLTYTGFAVNQNGTWYVKNGRVDFTVNSVIKDTRGAIGTTGTYWYVVGNRVQTTFTGLADYPNQNGWWYIENGQVTFTKNTVAKNKNGWYYVTGSKVQFGFTGLANYANENGWFYITNGHVDFSKNTVAKNKNGWYYVTGGKVQFGYTGLANYENENGWWYIKAGHVDFTYNGAASNKNGTWYIQGGKVIFGASGIVSTSTNAWYAEKGRIKTGYSGTLKVSNGNIYYYNGSTMATGWVAINKGYFYFDRSTGALKKGTTVDGLTLNAYGTAQTNSNTAERIKVMIKARAVYLSVISSGDSKATQLKKCFDWVLSHPYYRYRILPQARTSPIWICTYANDEFDNGKGCCVSEACAFSFLAYECGYTPYVCDDTGHAWTEIDGLVYDTLFAEAKSYTKYYGSTYATASLHRVNKTALY